MPLARFSSAKRASGYWKNYLSWKSQSLRFYPLQSCRMLLHFLTVDHRLAACRDCVCVIERDRHRVHMRLSSGVDPASLIEVEFQRPGVRGLEQHGWPIAHHAIMCQCQLATLVKIH